MEINKNEYSSYLVDTGKTEKTVSNYLSALKHITIKADGVKKDIDLFNCEDPLKVLMDIENSNNYKELNASTHNSYSAAIASFRDYFHYEKWKHSKFLSIKISNPDSVEIVNSINECGSNIEIGQLNQLKDEVKIGQLVFMVPFGDKVSWDKGLAGIAKVSAEPYDFENRNFKIKVDMICSFKTIKRSELTYYPDSYDAADIGPSTKGSQNQALKQITFTQAVSILRAIIDLRPETLEKLEEKLDAGLMNVVKGKMRLLKEVYSEYDGDNMENNETCLKGSNKIYYGIPGCGKSYKVSAMLDYLDEYKEEAQRNGIFSKVSEKNIFRTTFYLDYSNSDFVGQIYPVVEGKNVSYKPNPGPFTKALARAYLHKDEMVYLVIEEINRGNAASIFGDLFQLLDRLDRPKDDKKAGTSEYPISNEFIENYFKLYNRGEVEIDGETDKIDFIPGKIVIPNNLTIFVTMNTSDQNVFPLDTAFKRRWDRERVISDWSSAYNSNLYIPFTDITWGNFAQTINKKMIENCTDGTVTPDKSLGPYFITDSALAKAENRYDDSIENKQKLIKFTDNVIDYLYNDVTKFDHNILFNDIYSYEQIYNYFCNELGEKSKEVDGKKYLDIFNGNLEDDKNAF